MYLEDDESENSKEYDATWEDSFYGEEEPEVRGSSAVIVTSLPTDSLRWISKRRQINSQVKVAISHFREKQLRDIFDGLDYKRRGSIDFRDLAKAVNYVQAALHGRGGELLENLLQTFLEMDEDGNGELDFQEFCTGMCGGLKSTVNMASEHEIDKLHWKFVEFSHIYNRQLFLDKINGYHSKQPIVFSPLQKKTTSSRNLRKYLSKLPEIQGDASHASTEFASDYGRYTTFRNLFNIGWGLKTSVVKNFDDKNKKSRRASSANITTHGMYDAEKSHISDGLKREKERNAMIGPTGEMKLTRSAKVSQILFMTEARKLYMPTPKEQKAASAALEEVAKKGLVDPNALASPTAASTGSSSPARRKSSTYNDCVDDAEREKREKEYQEVKGRMRAHRIVAQEHLLRDPDTIQLQRRIEEEHQFMQKAMTYRPPGLPPVEPKSHAPWTFNPYIPTDPVTGEEKPSMYPKNYRKTIDFQMSAMKTFRDNVSKDLPVTTPVEGINKPKISRNANSPSLTRESSSTVSCLHRSDIDNLKQTRTHLKHNLSFEPGKSYNVVGGKGKFVYRNGLNTNVSALSI